MNRLLVLVLLLSVGCGSDGTARQAPPLPAKVIPPVLGDIVTAREKAADKAFTSAGPQSLTAHGGVWTLRADGAVRGALQVGVLKPKYDAREIEVRRGVRAHIETGQYRWFKVGDQWVGVQELSELTLYLWFPPGGTMYEILQVKPDVPEQKKLLKDILDYQRGTA